MKLARLVKRRYGIAARRVAVKMHVAWYWRGFVMLSALALGVALAWWIYSISSSLAGLERGAAEQELRRLKEETSRLQAENSGLQTIALKNERYSRIESAAQNDLTRSVKSLQEENARLKEELAFYRAMMAPGQGEGAASIYRFEVERNASPGEYRYRVLLLQSGQRKQEFQGRLQLVVNLEQDGEKLVLNVPEAGQATLQAYRVSFKYYQRMEGSFRVSPSAVVKSVQVRVFEDNAAQPKLTKTTSLS